MSSDLITGIANIGEIARPWHRKASQADVSIVLHRNASAPGLGHMLDDVHRHRAVIARFGPLRSATPRFGHLSTAEELDLSGVAGSGV